MHFSHYDFTLWNNVYFLKEIGGRQWGWGWMNAQLIKDWREKGEISKNFCSGGESRSITAASRQIWCWWLLDKVYMRIQFSTTKNFVMNKISYTKWQRNKSWIPSQAILNNMPDFGSVAFPGLWRCPWNYWVLSDNERLQWSFNQKIKNWLLPKKLICIIYWLAQRFIPSFGS